MLINGSNQSCYGGGLTIEERKAQMKKIREWAYFYLEERGLSPELVKQLAPKWLDKDWIERIIGFELYPDLEGQIIQGFVLPVLMFDPKLKVAAVNGDNLYVLHLRDHALMPEDQSYPIKDRFTHRKIRVSGFLLVKEGRYRIVQVILADEPAPLPKDVYFVKPALTPTMPRMPAFMRKKKKEKKLELTLEEIMKTFLTYYKGIEASGGNVAAWKRIKNNAEQVFCGEGTRECLEDMLWDLHCLGTEISIGFRDLIERHPRPVGDWAFGSPQKPRSPDVPELSLDALVKSENAKKLQQPTLF